MILPIHQLVRVRIVETAERLWHIAPAALPPIVIEYPPNRRLGDLAVPLAFELARRLRKPPRAIAQELVAGLGAVEGIGRIEAAPNGYVNFFFDRRSFLLQRLTVRHARGVAAPRGGPEGATTEQMTGAGPEDVPPDQASTKTIVEHTAINPNKAAHVGHLRNAALGDTLVRLLRFGGVPVEVQNYIDDTGVQVADAVVGFRELEGLTLDEVRQIADASRFDYYCWDLYARVTEWYEADRERLNIRAAVLHDIEHGGNDASVLGAFIADRIVRRHLETMARLNIDYDLLTWERDILRLQFWARAFEILKQAGAVFLRTEGPLAGCWVMRIEDDEESSPGDGADEDLGDTREKVIVRSNGTVTYVGKDIAYQFWKFGLLGLDFSYRPFCRRPDGRLLWATTSEPVPGTDPPPAFGRADRTYNVIDVRQSYLQKLLKQALEAMGYRQQAERSIHFSYEMVALSHATARQLGYETIDMERPFVEVSGRKGLGVKADDLLDRLADQATREVTRRNPDFRAEESRRTGEAIATAAIRYFMVKYSRGKVIAFDIDEALSFEGESGPYLQYSAVRAANIFQKLHEREGLREDEIVAALPDTDPGYLTSGSEADDLWSLVLEAARLDEIAQQAVRSLELSILAKYAFSVAQAFNAFYHRAPILNEDRTDVRRWRAAAVSYFRAQMTRALDLMGCEVPGRM
jgi:arginyl-tRNA synthetase